MTYDDSKSVEVLQPAGAAFGPLGFFEWSDTIQSAVLGALRLPTRDVFA